MKSTRHNPKLYHATCAALAEDGSYSLYPEELTAREQKTISGREGEFIFAGSNLPMAAAYALKTRKDDLNIAHLTSCGSCIFGIPIAWVDNASRFMTNHPVGRIFEVENETFHEELDRHGNPSGEWVSEARRVGITAVKDITPQYAMTVGVQIFSFKPEATNDEIKEFKTTEWREITANFKSESNPDGKWSPDNPKHLQECTMQYFDLLNNFIENGLIIHLNREHNLNPIDLKSGELRDDSFIKNPEKILQPTTITQPKEFSPLQKTASATITP